MKVVIEIPKGSHLKTEIDQHTGKLFVDRELAIPVPFSYGYLEGTLAEDGDPMDVFVLTRSPILPGTEVEVEIIGAFECVDNGEPDHKLLAMLPDGKASFAFETDSFDAIKNFLKTYKPGFQVIKSRSYEDPWLQETVSAALARAGK